MLLPTCPCPVTAPAGAHPDRHEPRRPACSAGPGRPRRITARPSGPGSVGHAGHRRRRKTPASHPIGSLPPPVFTEPAGFPRLSGEDGCRSTGGSAVQPRDYATAVGRRWVWVVAAGVLAALMAWSVTSTVAPTYRSSVLLYVGV